MSTDEYSLLKQISGRIIEQIYFVEKGNITLDSYISISNEMFQIFNKPTYELDNDDYACLHIVKQLECDCLGKYATAQIEEPIIKIILLRDTNCWKFNNDSWRAKCDIGIKLYTPNYKITFLAIDDMSTRISAYVQFNDLFIYGDETRLNRELSGFWRFKTDTSEVFLRNEIVVK
ncbi:MAG: hypothetical protein NC084_02925 [Bacteroides sp.]|nr:hypothetical protein [Bacteroides sp.]